MRRCRSRRSARTDSGRAAASRIAALPQSKQLKDRARMRRTSGPAFSSSGDCAALLRRSGRASAASRSSIEVARTPSRSVARNGSASPRRCTSTSRPRIARSRRTIGSAISGLTVCPAVASTSASFPLPSGNHEVHLQVLLIAEIVQLPASPAAHLLLDDFRRDKALEQNPQEQRTIEFTLRLDAQEVTGETRIDEVQKTQIGSGAIQARTAGPRHRRGRGRRTARRRRWRAVGGARRRATRSA